MSDCNALSNPARAEGFERLTTEIRGRIYVKSVDDDMTIYPANQERKVEKASYTNAELHAMLRSYGAAAKRLAAYESIGLSPARVAELAEAESALEAQKG